MAKKDKKKKVDDRITIRLEFEGQLKIDFSDFRFVERHENNKAAALFLIETALAEWKRNRTGDQKPTNPNGLSGNIKNDDPPQ